MAGLVNTPGSFGMTGKAWLFAFALSLFIGPALAQIESRPTPMWEGIEKSADDIENDNNLVRQALEITDGDARAAAFAMAQSGWEQISNGLPDDAIRRFNLAWLVKPDLPEIFWGFAIASHIRGDETIAVEALFEQTRGAFDTDTRFLTDRGRILEERQLPLEARPWFEKALALDANNIGAHFGMMRVAMALEDKELEEEHRTRFEALIEEENQ